MFLSHGIRDIKRITFAVARILIRYGVTSVHVSQKHLRIVHGKSPVRRQFQFRMLHGFVVAFRLFGNNRDGFLSGFPL